MDRLATKATPEGTLNYGYDAASNVASIVSNDANGVSVSYVYDQLNRLSTVTDSRLQGSQTTTYTNDPASNLGTVTYPNGVESAMTYDALNRISGLTTQSTGYLYQRGPTGNLTGATELNGRTLTWNYDGIYRLTNETIASDPSNNNGSVSYSLDPVGNRLSDSSTISGINSVAGTFNADDELSTETYDANGNTLSTGGKSFTYDAENHLTSMNGDAVTIVYDGDGNRVAKTVNGVTTKYLVDDLNPTGYPQVVEELVNGSVTRQYTYGLQRISENQPIGNTWTVSFYGYGGGGSVRQLTNVTGAVTDTYEYDAFGVGVATSGHTPNEMLYRSEQYDSDLGLYYLRARYYNPLTGRFLSRDPEDGDPTDPETLHKYLYASSDPVDRLDPSGREAVAETGETSIIGKLGVAARAALPYAVAVGAGAGTGATAWTVTAATLCLLQYDIEGIKAVTGSMGLLGKFWFLASGCQIGFDPAPSRGNGPPPPPPPPPTPPCQCKPGWHMHHMLPQNEPMKAWFAERGLNVDDPQFLVCMPPGAHIGKGGLHPNGWNPEWKQFMTRFPEATEQQVLDQLQQMENEWRFQKPLNSCQD